MKKKDLLEKESVELEQRREESKESSTANIRHLTAKLEKVETEVMKVPTHAVSVANFLGK